MQKNYASKVNKNQLESENKWTVSASDISLDLKILLDDYFRATLLCKDDCLIMNFENGQTFLIDIKSIG